MAPKKPTPQSKAREQIATGLVVYPIVRKDGRIVWVTIPRKSR